MKQKFGESSIGELYQTNLAGIEYNWYAGNSHLMYESIMIATSDFLADNKGSKRSLGLKFTDVNHRFLAGAMVQYHENEDPEMPGNYTYEFTIDESDMDGITCVEMTDPQFKRVLADRSSKHAGIGFNKDEYALPLVEYAFKTLLEWLDKVAIETEEVSLELDGYFIATVAIENGQKVFSIVPDGAMKRLIKDDESVQAA